MASRPGSRRGLGLRVEESKRDDGGDDRHQYRKPGAAPSVPPAPAASRERAPKIRCGVLLPPAQFPKAFAQRFVTHSFSARSRRRRILFLPRS